MSRNMTYAAKGEKMDISTYVSNVRIVTNPSIFVDKEWF